MPIDAREGIRRRHSLDDYPKHLQPKAHEGRGKAQTVYFLGKLQKKKASWCKRLLIMRFFMLDFGRAWHDKKIFAPAPFHKRSWTPQPENMEHVIRQ
jgi:hypothetical protein